MIKRAKKLIEKAWAHKGLRHYGANTSWLFAEKAVRMAIGFPIGIYVARQLGPTDFGVLSYAISFVMLFACLSELGLNGIVVRELVKNPDQRDDLLGTSFVLKFGGFVMMISLIWLSLLLINDNTSTNWLILIIAGGYLFQSFQVTELYFQAEVKSKYVAISQIFALVILSVFRFYFAYKKFPLVYFAGLEAAFMFLSITGYVFFYFLIVNSIFKWNFHLEQAKSLLKESWPLLLSGGATIIHMHIDRIMLKELASPAEVGYYSLAARIATLWYFIPVIIGMSLFPAIVRARKISVGLYYTRLRRFVSFLIWIAIGLACFMSIFSKPLIALLGGDEYSKSATILSVLSWVLVLVFFGSARRQWLLAEGLQRHILICSVVGAVVNVVLNYYMIPYWGGLGSAWATIIAFAVTFLVVPLFLKKSSINNMLFWRSFYSFWKYK